jgi:hypothetical protein
MSNKIGGAKRKLAKMYDLDFLDGPILEAPSDENVPRQYAWWIRNEQGQDILMQECFDYVLDQTENKQYDAILGFSQGGLLATALVSSGRMTGIKAVVTAGAPFVQDVWDFCMAPTDDDSVAEETRATSKQPLPMAWQSQSCTLQVKPIKLSQWIGSKRYATKGVTGNSSFMKRDTCSPPRLSA